MRYCLDSIGLHVKPSAVLRLALYRTLAVALAALAILSTVIPAPAFAADSDQQVKTVRVGWLVTSQGYQEGTPGERLSGWGYDYLQTLSYYTKGWKYEYVSGTFTELMDMLEAGEIDLMPNISYSAERAQKLLYSSNPEGTERYYIYAKPDRDDLSKGDPEALEGLTIGCNPGVMQTTVGKQWLANEGITCTFKEIDGGSALFDALANDEVDAIIMNDTISSPDASPMFYVGSSDYYFAVPKSRPDLMNDINAAMTAINRVNPRYNDEIKSNYSTKTVDHHRSPALRPLGSRHTATALRSGILQTCSPTAPKTLTARWRARLPHSSQHFATNLELRSRRPSLPTIKKCQRPSRRERSMSLCQSIATIISPSNAVSFNPTRSERSRLLPSMSVAI